MYTTEVWAAGPVLKDNPAIKVLARTSQPPTMRRIKSLQADATATWRRQFVIGKGVEKYDAKTSTPDPELQPKNVGFKVTGPDGQPYTVPER